MHYGVEKGDMPKDFWNYIDISDIVLTEIDTRIDEQKEEYAQTFPYVHRSKEDKSVKSVLTDEEYRVLLQKLQQLRPTETPKTIEAAADLFSLFGLKNVLSNATEPSMVGELEFGDWVRVRTKFMLDRQIREYAIEKKKFVDQLDERKSKEFTKCMVGTDEENLKDIRLFLKNKVIVHDYAEFENSFHDYREGLPRGERYTQLPECLLEGRNKMWMDKIRAVINNYQTPFFVVGALHLVADKGSLLEMLKAQNYQVRRIEDLDPK